MSIPDKAVEAATDTLNDEGGKPGHDLHSWRCLDPERYGPCDCTKVTARLMLEAAEPYLTGELRVQLADAIDAVEIGAGSEHFRHGRETMRDDAISAVQDALAAHPEVKS